MKDGSDDDEDDEASAAAVVVTRGTIESIRRDMYSIHESQDNLTYEWRRRQLRQLRKLVSENEPDICDCLYEDLGKIETVARCTEIAPILDELAYVASNSERWTSEEPQLSSPGICFPARCRLQRRPLAPPGVLVLGPSNYPFSFCIQPLVGALACGNPCLIKPSEHCPATCRLLTRLVPRYFGGAGGPPPVQVVTGAVAETSLLLERRWGKVFFTGSPQVGQIVARAASNTLTPTLLECGGKCPCVVDLPTCCYGGGRRSNGTVQMMAHRIVWARTLNAGQSCAAVDYVVLVTGENDEGRGGAEEEFVRCLVRAVRLQFGATGDGGKSSELGRIVTAGHARRHVQLLQEVEQSVHQQRGSDSKDAAAEFDIEIAAGGSSKCDASSRYIDPAVIVFRKSNSVNSNCDDWTAPLSNLRLFKEEIFGPILPVVIVRSRSHAVELVKRVSGMAPLCLYAFTSQQSVFDFFANSIAAGSCVRNDALVHLASTRIPFGGLGKSGYGNYHGPYSLDAFCHLRPVVYRPCFKGSDVGMVRYHPFGNRKGKLAAALMSMPYVPVLVPNLVRRYVRMLIRKSSFLAVLGPILVGIWLAGGALQHSPVQPLWNRMAGELAFLLEGAASWLREAATPTTTTLEMAQSPAM